MARKPYPSDVSASVRLSAHAEVSRRAVTDEEWAFVVTYLTLMKAEAPQREHDLREVYNALRWMVRAGAPWRMIPHDWPPWHAVYDQTQRWIAADVFATMAHDLRTVLRLMQGRKADPSAVVLDPGAPGHVAEHARERPACRLRRGQTQERIEDPHRGGHAGLPARRDWPCT